jgi:hypothetical protein
VVTVVPKVWSPFAAKFALPKIGWVGVFGFAIAFNVIASALAFFVLRRMKVPAPSAAAVPASQAVELAA